ncbi:hypothetical protein PoB_001928700 [Plakobranchus ocellatus]|uniref:Uncharacterized protein n=1 Tax=Plakobranchus ocellatus TaxID=259542 RepID=A0AAV3ZE28_9GAST|nr:hypothetical protein PoB_001928700 [Plakobranchus ocellatus]
MVQSFTFEKQKAGENSSNNIMYSGPSLKTGFFHWISKISIASLQNILRISETAKKTKEIVLNEANKRRSLVRTIMQRQATFLGHVMRRGKLEHLVTTGKLEGKRSRGRQREKIMDGLARKSVRYTGRRQR